MFSFPFARQGWALALAAVMAAGSLLAATAAQAQTTLNFSHTGAAQPWVVPAGVTSVTIVAEGAQGFDSGAVLGGRGGRATGVLAVTPGETLQINVGGRGVAAVGSGVIMGGGFNGGGNGVNNGPSSVVVGGGGGASDVRQGGTALADRKIVGAGGGGSTANGTPGGNGGGLVGADGGVAGGGSIGTGGTQAAGGTIGGALGVGGHATVASTPWVGGGGGGYYGGGVSSAHSGGGGGSSYLGGVTGGSTVAGVRAGDGLVSITYVSPAPVPTMSEWAMILLGVMLAGGAALYIQRRPFAV
ncbi:IPTL-CTERM sorting domain-containing protein [Brevundimonas sp.]|uniref:IPTL-CTERM sorting domain-containing protein n=1 Tax=Brevundimonas sp. TaxID=1871086 RepID=UPI002ED9EDCD